MAIADEQMSSGGKREQDVLHRAPDMGRRGPLPLKRERIAQWVRRKIARGEIAPGDPLPSREWFVRKFTPNPRTVQEAFDELRRDGLVETVRGHATRVARRMPFEGRYLLLTKAMAEDAGSRLFARALSAAAAELARTRRIAFDVKPLTNVEEMTPEYMRVLDSVRRQQYAGVVMQSLNDLQSIESVANIDDVPIAYFGRRGLTTQGNCAKCLNPGAPENGIITYADVFSLHCGDIAAAKAESVAVFAPLMFHAPMLENQHLEAAAEHGLRIAKNGYHEVDMYHWHPRQFRRLAATLLSLPGIGPRTAFVLEDDNMLSIFEEAVVERFGKGIAKKMCVCCHANSPILPKSSLNVKFHGMDCTATLASAIDYADACRRNERNPAPPRVVVF